MSVVAVIGLGEAGRRYAEGLADAGADVRGFDPVAPDPARSVHRLGTIEDVVAEADVVLSLVGAAASAAVAERALPAMRSDAVFADLNTGTPELKRRISAVAEQHGVPMADVAVLAPVPRSGHRTPLVASGPGAAALAELLRPFAVPIDVLDAPVGAAAQLKLLRSVFMKGLAALVIEGVEAARAAGAEPWLRAQMAAELGPAGAALVDRLIDGTYQHAVRREHEVRDALAALESAHLSADMTRATLVWFERIVAEQAAG